jgi:hypothetical protein
MKNERVFNGFCALSFGGNAVTGEDAPDPSVSQPRLTPESVQDFDVHQVGSAGRRLPQPERPGATRRRSRRTTLPIEFRQIRRRWLRLPVAPCHLAPRSGANFTRNKFQTL